MSLVVMQYSQKIRLTRMSNVSTNRLKDDALELALLLYDIYKEQAGGKIDNGQSNANDTKDD